MVHSIRALLLCLICTLATPLQAAIVDIDVANFHFTPHDLTIHPGDTVRWTSSEGFHDVHADNGSFGRNAANAPWTFTQTFDQLGEVRYHCSVHSVPGGNIDTAENGIIRIVPAPPNNFTINQGISGGWFNQSLFGEGFLIDIDPIARFLFIAWFTFDDTASSPQGMPKIGGSTQRWLTIQGSYSGSGGNFPIYATTGGHFGSGQGTTTNEVGTMNIDFTSCTSGLLTYWITPEGLSGSIPIRRLLEGTAPLCQSLAGTAEPEVTP